MKRGQVSSSPWWVIFGIAIVIISAAGIIFITSGLGGEEFREAAGAEIRKGVNDTGPRLSDIFPFDIRLKEKRGTTALAVGGRHEGEFDPKFDSCCDGRDNDGDGLIDWEDRGSDGGCDLTWDLESGYNDVCWSHRPFLDMYNEGTAQVVTSGGDRGFFNFVSAHFRCPENSHVRSINIEFDPGLDGTTRYGDSDCNRNSDGVQRNYVFFKDASGNVVSRNIFSEDPVLDPSFDGEEFPTSNVRDVRLFNHVCWRVDARTIVTGVTCESD